MKHEEYLLKQHILFEFLHNDPNKVSLFYEGRSVVPGIDTILAKIMDMFQSQIYEVVNSAEQTVSKVYNDINEIGLRNLFFNEINFEIKLCHAPESKINGGLNIGDGYQYTGEETKIQLSISFNVNAPDENEFRRLLYLGFGHEITHAYGIYQYMIKYKKNFLTKDYFARSNYNRFKTYVWDTKNEKILKTIHYRLSKLEMNAYIAQLRQELLPMKKTITDANSAMNAIRQTESFKKNYLFLKQNMNAILSFCNVRPDDIKGKEVQQHIINTTNYIAKKDFTTYEQVAKYYLTRWEYYKKEYMAKASRIAYDVYSDNNFMFDGNEI